MLSGLAAQVGTQDYQVDISLDGEWVQFSIVNKQGIDPNFVDILARGNAWPVLSLIQEWGEVLLIDDQGNYWAIAPGGKVGANFGNWGIRGNNMFAVRFPLKKFRSKARENKR